MQQQPFNPTASPKKPWYRTGKGCIGILLAWVLLVCIINGVNHSSAQHPEEGTIQTTMSESRAQVTPTQKPHVVATAAPTQKPNPSPTTSAMAVTHGTPHLGGAISDFYGKYGNPINMTSKPAGNDALWELNADGSLSLVARNTGGGTVGYLALTTPDWGAEKIKETCLQFAPSDYTLDPTSPQGSYDPIVYNSPSGKFALHIEFDSCWANTLP